jgi:hypothetical protein
MNQQSAKYTGTVRHRAEDDLFHFDRSVVGRSGECDTGLSVSNASARYWVIGMRPRWLMGASQPLVRPRSES